MKTKNELLNWTLVIALGCVTGISGWSQDEPVDPKAKERRKKAPIEPDALEASQERLAAVQDQIRIAQEKNYRAFQNLPTPVAPPDAFLGDMFGESRGAASPAPALIIQNTPDAGHQTELQEDLAIMSRILNKAAAKDHDRDRSDRVMGIVISSAGAAKPPQSLYLEGYGAVFLLNTKFPLTPPPANEEPKTEAPANSTWEETKQELFGGTAGSRVVTWKSGLVEDRPAEYDADKVEELKDSLLEAFKNASRIRHLKPDESVVIAVNGSRGGGGATHVRLFSNADAKVATVQGKANKLGSTITSGSTQNPSAKTTTLTLRAKKSDIDAFASGKKTLEEFKQKVTVQAY